MVKRWRFVILKLAFGAWQPRASSLLLAVVWTHVAVALHPQTDQDLDRLRDLVATRLGNDSDGTLADKALPLVLARTQPYWQESVSDFQGAVQAALFEALPEPAGRIFLCRSCPNLQEARIVPGSHLEINQGDFSVAEMAAIRDEQPQAKSVAVIRETPSGVMVRLVSLQDSELLLAATVDSTTQLSKIAPAWGTQREMERRRRGEGLYHSRINFGFYPDPSLQLEFLEQWGDRNQHVTGLGLSLINPVGAIGAGYRFVSPLMSGIDAGAAVYYPLTALFGSSMGSDLMSDLAYQVSVSRQFAKAYGVFVALTLQRKSSLTIGISFYNPLLLPFML